MKICPTNAINPAWGEAGLAGFWTPLIIPKQGYCELSCTLCSQLCPTGAIRPITPEEKKTKPIRIGSASIDRGRCLPWSGNGPCIVCEEVCPTSPKAIVFDTIDTTGADGESLKLKLPKIRLQYCIGCGICENKCPISGSAAVRVIAAGETRNPRHGLLL
jgi:formate hydrogenlyase subunit 6/NADH:ubiquinone oxidoreductase subunit I